MDWSKLCKGETTTLGVCWNLIGHEGNISSVAAGLPVNKAARINKSKISKNHQKNKRGFRICFQLYQKVEEPNPPFSFNSCIWSQEIMQKKSGF